MTRTVADAAVLLQAIAGADARDPLSREGAQRGPHDFVSTLSEDGLRGVRLGVVRAGLFGKSAKVDGIVEAALDDVRRLGAILVDPANIATWGQFDESELEVLLYEFKTDLASYLGSRGAGVTVKDLADLMAFNQAHASEELRHFGQELFEMSARKGPLTDPAYRRALTRNRQLAAAQGIDATLRAHRVDALVGPTGSLPALIDLVNGDSGYFGASTPSAVAGYPHVTVPAGFVRGLPVGLSFFGPAWSDGALLRYAFAYEQATRHRRPPRFSSTADLT
jgi:amidase